MLQKIINKYSGVYGSKLYPSFFDLYLSGKKVIGYYGFLGDQNFGDEWVYESAKALFPNCVVLPLQNNMTIGGLLIKTIFQNKIKGIIIGGGTLIGPRFWHKEIFTKLKRKGLPVFVHGTGVHKRNDYNQIWSIMLKDVHYGGVRGHLSVENLLKLGGVKTKVIGDAAFAMFENKKVINNSKRVLVNLGTHAPYEGEEVVRSSLKKYIKYLYENQYQPVFYPFHTNDIVHAKSLKAEFPEMEILPIPATYEETVSAFRESAFAIGERLHFTVIAILSGCPLFAINYGKKHFDLLNSIKADHLGYAPEESSFENMASVFESRASQDFDQLFKNIQALKTLQFDEAQKFTQSFK
jgi:polysaccharide pyruvyl transferase WcaK-like protein